jgi:formamidopyrimidine-DNA glycosylase
MPELPEVETVVRTLEHKIQGRRIEEVDVLWKNIIFGMNQQEFQNSLKGQRFNSFGRRGKFLILGMDDYNLVAHLRMEGKFYVYRETTKPDKHTHIIFKLDKGELHYNDVRKFGRFYLYRKDQTMEAISKLGFEPFDEELTEFKLKKYCRNVSTPIKTQLLDQEMIAGIGNIYANEICHAVNIDPCRPACLISLNKWKEIIEASRNILRAAIKQGGTTIRSYTSSLGVTGLFQINLKVHGKKGEQCPECGTVIEKISLNGRGTYFCPNCQKARPVLAAVSGNIGSGKSTVCAMIREKGYTVLSCDAINAELLKHDSTIEALSKIISCKKEEFSKDVLRGRIFSDANIRKEVEDYLHARIWDTIMDEYENHCTEKALFVEVPLLFETDWYRRFDLNILVRSDREDITERLKQTRQMSQQDIDRLLGIQKDDSQKAELCDIVIMNDSTLPKLSQRVEKMLSSIVKLYKNSGESNGD